MLIIKPQPKIASKNIFLDFSVKFDRARISSIALKYLYNSATLLILFIEKYDDMAKARLKQITGRAIFLNPWRQAESFISQNASKIIKLREYTEFAQG
ncbi:MAG: hypothetical protein M0R17_10770 [Candidatus Omnitrophica bacterium]|jgi:hypothetical protein|nr:hypothetical protein [Candidatus Omnitrophota bacterium]MDD5252630.1 hypothetical protein [Candidatus Omnitrophota bacterium]